MIPGSNRRTKEKKMKLIEVEEVEE